MQPTSFFHKDDVSSKLQTVSMTEYMLLDNLTEEEKNALRHYQDHGNKQYKWDTPIDKTVKHPDCYVINGALRDSDCKAKLSEKDRKLWCELVRHIDNAISKNYTTEPLTLMKGLNDASWLCEKRKGDDYFDKGFGSFTIDASKLVEYAVPQKKGVYKLLPNDHIRVMIQRNIEAGKNAMYMGSLEEEILLPRGVHYLITDVEEVPAGVYFEDTKTIVNYVVEI